VLKVGWEGKVKMDNRLLEHRGWALAGKKRAESPGFGVLGLLGSSGISLKSIFRASKTGFFSRVLSGVSSLFPTGIYFLPDSRKSPGADLVFLCYFGEVSTGRGQGEKGDNGKSTPVVVFKRLSMGNVYII